VILAAIDIGTNASRLLISEVQIPVDGEPVFNKLNLIRVPLRLGFDVFETGEISKEKKGMMFQTMKAYAHLMKAYGVHHHIAVATSAMRDAKNSDELVRKIFLETGINIKIISGDQEATLIYESHVAEHLNADSNYLYIDVGGGSTELTFFFKWGVGLQAIIQYWHHPDPQRYGDGRRLGFHERVHQGAYQRPFIHDRHWHRRKYQQGLLDEQEKGWQAASY